MFSEHVDILAMRSNYNSNQRFQMLYSLNYNKITDTDLPPTVLLRTIFNCCMNFYLSANHLVVCFFSLLTDCLYVWNSHARLFPIKLNRISFFLDFQVIDKLQNRG